MSSCSYIDQVSWYQLPIPDKQRKVRLSYYSQLCWKLYPVLLDLENKFYNWIVLFFSWCFFLAPLSGNLLWKLSLGNSISQHAMWNQFNQIALALHLTSLTLLNWVNWTLFVVPTTHKSIDPLRNIVKEKTIQNAGSEFGTWIAKEFGRWITKEAQNPPQLRLVLLWLKLKTFFKKLWH